MQERGEDLKSKSIEFEEKRKSSQRSIDQEFDALQNKFIEDQKIKKMNFVQKWFHGFNQSFLQPVFVNKSKENNNYIKHNK